jgi:hypothetical protein
MATDKQIKANRQNAQKSTGPKTAEGKAAVSQNAVKHGLFTDSLIRGENPADYAVFHDEMLADLAPVGAVETMLAERVISLWWRLRRAERMQNQALDDMIETCITNPLPRRLRRMECHGMGVPLGDERALSSHLPLGRVARLDWAHDKSLERMIMYERRIESSLNRTMNELKSHQKIRRSEREDAGKEQAAPNQAILKAFEPSALNRETYADPLTRRRERQTSEYWDRVAMRQMEAEERSNLEKQRDLLKQSHFPVDDIDIKAFLKIAYGDDPDDEAGEDKAKRTCPEPVERSQSRLAPRDALGVEKEKSVTAATG